MERWGKQRLSAESLIAFHSPLPQKKEFLRLPEHHTRALEAKPTVADTTEDAGRVQLGNMSCTWEEERPVLQVRSDRHAVSSSPPLRLI